MKKIFVHEGIPLEKLDKLFIYTVLATILGARLGHVFFYDWAYYKEHLEEILLPVRFHPHFQFTGFAGLASHGAAVGIITALYFSAKTFCTNLCSIYWTVSVLWLPWQDFLFALAI